MIKYALLAAAWMLPLASVHAQPALSWEDTVKESIDATQVPDMPTSPDGMPTPSDLTLDPAFSADGMFAFSSPRTTGYSNIEDGLRVFPYTECTGAICSLSGYYVFGREQATDYTWSAFITRIKLNGEVDTTFGSSGWIFPSDTNTFYIVDAAMAGDRVYWLSTFIQSGAEIMRVTCSLLTDGSSCFTGSGGYVDFGATTVAQRMVYDSRYGLFIAGIVFTARGSEIAVARLNATTGLLINEFHGNGTTSGLPAWSVQTDSTAGVSDMAVVPDGTPGGERLYIAGTIKRSESDSDGFVLGLNPNDGYTQTAWAWKPVYFEDDNTGYKKDAVTAITVQRNGRLAVAGWSETDVDNESSMILGRFNADGTLDYSFCGGAGVCKRNFPWPGVVAYDRPSAIAEREGNRDLVVAVMYRRPAASDPRPRQNVVQFGSSGNVKHAQRTMDYPAGTGVTPWSRPNGMWVGLSGPNGVGPEVVAVVGVRTYTDYDWDATLSHLIATDSIYADQFGGTHSD